MTTTLAPDRTVDGVDLDRVHHLVHVCQLHPDGTPRARPVLAMCGWKCSDHGPTTADPSRHCAMCLVEDRCPACGKAPGLE